MNCKGGLGRNCVAYSHYAPGDSPTISPVPHNPAGPRIMGVCHPSHLLTLLFLLQVPQGEWNNTLSRDKDSEIPCRRMRSGSYIKAMGDDDSEDSETSPKPSPKTAARRQSYLKATQQSLSEQSTTQR